jgi:hypothetical protein
MPRFRKRPIVVEAERFDGTIECAERLSREYASNVWPQFGNTFETHMDWTGRLYVDTHGGLVVAEPGDWIVTGIDGERYPCRPGLFEALYEPDEAKAVPIRLTLRHRIGLTLIKLSEYFLDDLAEVGP